MPKLLFLVHGMGINPVGWSSKVVARLDRISNQYAWFREHGPFSRHVAIHEIHYDDVFERYVHGWQQSARELDKAARDQNLKLPRTIAALDGVILPLEVQNHFWTTLIDPILYRGFALARQEALARVMDQFAQAIVAQTGPVDASVLCHSQGTILTHDALALLGSQPVNGNNAFTVAGGFRFENLFMLANVSRLGPYHLDPYTSCVRPASAPAGALGCYCRRLYSFAHEYDPFTLWQRFEPNGWGVDYHGDARLDHVHAANVHGFDHYLVHPAVHVPIFNRMVMDPALGRPVIDSRERLRTFPPFRTETCGTAIEELKTTCRRLTDAQQRPRNLDQIGEAGLAFYRAVHSAATACRDLGWDLAD